MTALNGNGDFSGRPHPTRYRITDGEGKAYAPFRLKPGVSIRDFIAKHVPVAMQDHWELTEVRS